MVAVVAEQLRSSEATGKVPKRMVCATNHCAAVRGAAAGGIDRDKQNDRRDVRHATTQRLM